MCTTPDEIGPAPPGWIRAAWDRLFGRTRPDPPATPARPGPTDAEIEAFGEFQRQRDRNRGVPMCSKCGSRRDVYGGVLHRRWCSTCDQDYLEDVIAWPLVARMGRKKARESLRALVSGELRLSDRKSAL